MRHVQSKMFISDGCGQSNNPILSFRSTQVTIVQSSRETGDIDCWLSRCRTARGSGSGLSMGGPTKVKASKSFLFTNCLCNN